MNKERRTIVGFPRKRAINDSDPIIVALKTLASSQQTNAYTIIQGTMDAILA